MTQEVLEIHANNAHVPNTFIKQETSAHLAILFPGLGYTADMPLLYYTTKLLATRGADVLQLRYNYQSESFQLLSQEAQYLAIIADCTAAYMVATRQRAYKHITLLGKSLGTLALGHLLTQTTEFNHIKFIWLTPLFNNEHLQKQILLSQHESLFVIGTKDPHYTPEVLTMVANKTGGESFIVEGANHSMEVESVTDSIRIMQDYLSKVSIFLDS